MSDNTTKDSPDNPEKETQTQNKIIPTPDGTVANPISETISHTAPLKKSKKRRNYFWEFFMLFLAVFCGFLAQWQLENILDRA